MNNIFKKVVDILGKIRSGIIYFFFLTSFFLTVYLIYIFYAELEFNIFLFGSILLGVLMLSIFWNICVNKIEKRIEENKYSLWWLIKLNVLFSIILFNFLVFFSIMVEVIMSNVFHTSSEGFVTLILSTYGCFVTPFVIFIFSFIPSLFFWKFYLNKKLLKIISIFFIILSCIFFSFSIGKLFILDILHMNEKSEDIMPVRGDVSQDDITNYFIDNENDWATYTQNENFQVKYPPDFFQIADMPESEKSELVFALRFFISEVKEADVDFYVFNNPNSISVQEWAESNPFFDYSNYKQEKINVNGVEGLKFKINEKSDEALISYKNKMFKIVFISDTKDGKIFFNRILSTFKVFPTKATPDFDYTIINDPRAKSENFEYLNLPNNLKLVGKRIDEIDRTFLNIDFNNAFENISIGSAKKATLDFGYQSCCEHCQCSRDYITYYEIDINQEQDVKIMKKIIENSIVEQFEMGYKKKEVNGVLRLIDKWDGSTKSVPLNVFIWKENEKLKIAKTDFINNFKVLQKILQKVDANILKK